ncbi:MAG: CARDB domain-containing protein, partial [Candidatus Aenigmatarchaeota archaeon]
EKNCTNLTYVIIRDFNVTGHNLSSQIVCNYTGYKPSNIMMATPIFALNASELIFKNATLSLPLIKAPNYVLHCTNWSFETMNCSNWSIINKNEFVDYYENATHMRFTVTSFQAYGGGSELPDLIVNSITFNATNAKENEELQVRVNVSNEGSGSVTNANLTLKISLWNGSSWVNETSQSQLVNLSVNEAKIINFTWIAKPGTWRFNATIDPNNEIEETNESNNEKLENYTVSGWHIFYGKVNSTIVLTSSEGINFTRWIPSIIDGTLYFADYDSSFSFSNLKPLNGTNDLEEADIALHMNGFNDSIKRLFDANNDNQPDATACFIVNAQQLCNVPIINSTDNNYGNFVTGILWDSGDGGSEYDGTQDLIFITKINQNKQGSYGVYDYEIRVPAYLRELKGENNLVSIYIEIID